MRRVWSGGLVVVAVVVFALAGYVLVHDHPVSSAGHVPHLPTAESIGTSLPSASAGASSASSGPAPVVAFVGDDWTAGVGASVRAKRFSTLLSAALHLQERNFGVAGSGYAKQGRTGSDYASRVDDIVAAQPAVVVVSGGRNDVSDDPKFVSARATQLFKRLRSKLPDATVLAVEPMWGDSPAPGSLRKVADAVRQAALGAGVQYLPVHDPILGHPGFMADDTHPDDKGYAAIAAALRPGLTRLVPS